MPEKTNKIEIPAYKSAARLAIAIQILLVISNLISIFAIFFDFGGLVCTFPSSPPKPDSVSLLKDAQLLVESIVFIEALAFFACGICFLIWIRRLRRNLQYFGINDLKTKAWHCTWGFIIPIAAVFLPYKSIQEIWRASNATAVSNHWQNLKGSALVSWWWGFWLLMNATARISDRIKTVDAQGNIDVPAYTAYFTASAANEVLTFVTAILAIFVVRKLTSKQELMYKTLPAQNEVAE